MKLPHLILIILSTLFFNACNDPISVNPVTYKVVSDDGEYGLETKDGKEILEKKYKSIALRYDLPNNRHYVVYRTKEDKLGLYIKDFEKPTLELGSEYKLLEFINSEKYFAFLKNEKNAAGYHSKGVIDKHGNVIIENKYNDILHDGNELFFVSDFESNKFKIINSKEEELSPNRYEFIWTKFGVTFGYVHHLGNACIINQKGEEATGHYYSNIAIKKCVFDESKIFFHSTERGIGLLYYPNGEKIYDGKYRIVPLDISLKETYAKSAEKYPNKNLIGVFFDNKKKYFLTYEGEILEI